MRKVIYVTKNGETASYKEAQANAPYTTKVVDVPDPVVQKCIERSWAIRKGAK